MRQANGRTRMRTTQIIAAALALSALLSACKEENTYQAPPPPTVTVSPPLREKVTNYLEVTGTTGAYNAVDLVARVEGYLTSVNFEDGKIVENETTLKTPPALIQQHTAFVRPRAIRCPAFSNITS